MAVLKDVFYKKGLDPSLGRPAMDVPAEKVIVMREQGLSNNQIVEALQREGYTLDLINNAINQADIKEGVLTQVKGETMPNIPPMQGPMSMQMGPPNMGPGPMQMPPQMQFPTEAQVMPEERIQEIAEAIIDEKWSELIANVNRIIEWKDETEAKINRLSQQVNDLKDSFDKLHEGVLGRISDYDKSIKEVGTDIKALEKVFQKILPGFVENVNELSRITSRMKAKPAVVRK